MSKPNELRLNLIQRRTAIITAATLALSALRNGGMQLLNLQRATGQAIVLPFATGKGGKFRAFVGITITGSTTIHTAAGNNPKTAAADVIQGIGTVTGTTPGNFGTASNTNTITMNGSTLGGLVGTQLILEDVAPGIWAIEYNGLGSGTAATPFSNT